MSAPVCLRSTFRACRPCRSNQISARTNFIASRTYAGKAEHKTKGIPQTSSKEERKEVLDKIPETDPAKRPFPPGNVQNNPAAVAPGTQAGEVSALVSKESQTEPTVPPKLLPPNVIAAYRAPLKHTAQYGVPVASLQLRSYSVRSLEFFSDFALRAAFYLNLPASGPVPLPKRRERWTMPRSNFVHKKSQENFERITYKRLITVMDGEKSAVEVWLSVLRKWQFYGVGMKANVWEWEGIDVASKMDAQSKELEKDLEAKLANFGWNKAVAKEKSMEEMVQTNGVRHTGIPMMHVREGSRYAKPEI